MWNQSEVAIVKKYPTTKNIEINQTNFLFQSAERKYFRDELLERKSNLTKSWQVIKTVINERKYTHVNTKFKVNGATTNDGSVIASNFNSLFVNVGTAMAKSISPTDEKPCWLHATGHHQ